MAFLKNFLSKTTPVEPLNDVIRTKIEQLVVSQLDNYEKNYNRELFNVFNEWKAAGKKFTFEELDQESHNRAGIKSFKETVTNKTWDEVEDDVDHEVKTKSTNDMVIKASNIAGKKAVGVMVSQTVDTGIKKITQKAEARKRSKNNQ